ncbi:MAG: type II toxin-antitoxin system Phd/YefM family antitoxin [Vicinamibacteria bacterium]
MKRISIQDLKAGLSAVIAEAEGGQTVLVTRHNRAVARLSPVSLGRGQGDGPPLGAPALTPLLRKATGGRYLRVLKDDRSAGR